MGNDLGRLILRLALGAMILTHGVTKIIAGPAFIVSLVAKAGLPPPVAYLVYVGEVLAPLLIIIGVWTRAAAFVVVVNMVVAVWLAHMNLLWKLNDTGGYALELQVMYLATALAIALLGAGRYSVGGSGGRWN